MVDSSLSMGLHDADSSPVPAEPSRAQQVQSALADTTFLQDLRRTHDVVLFRFDQDLERLTTFNKLPASPSAEEARPDQSTTKALKGDDLLAPRGAETRLGQAIGQILVEEHNEPVSGLIVITDGQQNAGIEPASVLATAREAGIPIFTIGIGSDRQSVNVRVSDFVAPARAYPGDKYTATGYLQSQGLAGQTVSVELLSSEASAGAARYARKSKHGRRFAAGHARGRR